ncbi:MAG: TetR/AcrR family transcriptional regulator [Acidobacteriota bacterium]
MPAARTKTASRARAKRALGEREIGKRQTREALIDAGLAEFREKGLDAPSLDSICARAGFTRGAFYVHFADREQFLVAAMEKLLETFLDAIIATGDEAHDLERTVSRFAQMTELLGAPRQRGRAAGPGLPFHHVLEACSRSPRIQKRFVALLSGAGARVSTLAAEGQAAGTVRRDVRDATLGSVLVCMALGTLVALEAGIPFDADAARALVLKLVAP